MKKLISVVIRTLNESRHLDELLSKVADQNRDKYDIEVVIVDSGSTDSTLNIAKKWQSRIAHIKKEDFSFGRSLNVGCDLADGEFLVFISGHCIPIDENWIANLVKPLEADCVYSYGQQLGRGTTKFSERQLFSKYFPSESRIPQKGFFINNANSAIRKDVWKSYLFDEELTGCEDMYLAKTLVADGYKIGYAAKAGIYHIHDESWKKVQIRYEREAIALQRIMPEVHVTLMDTIKFISVGIFKDLRVAINEKVLIREIHGILRFRYAQYMGAYKGNHMHRKLSHRMKMKYFYPRITDMDIDK